MRYDGGRKSKFIDRKQQIRFAIELGLYALLLPLFFLVISLADPIAGLVMGRTTAQPLLYMILAFCADRWWALLFALSFVVSFSVLFSHRIFGPMRSFENAILQKQLHPTEPVPCKLRSDDYFHDFSELFDEFLNDSKSLESPEQRVGQETGTFTDSQADQEAYDGSS